MPNSHGRLSPQRTIRAIVDAAQRWLNADFPPRVRVTQALIARTGYSEPMIDFAFDALFRLCTTAELEAAIIRELGSLAVLDGAPLPGPGPLVYARPVKTVTIIASRTTIGVAFAPAIFALIAGANVLVKDREDNFLREFFLTLAEEEPALRNQAVSETWIGAEHPERLAADVVAAFGNDATLRAIRNQLPATARFIGYGSRISCGIIRLADISGDESTAVFAAAARDVVLYEGEGCMSLQFFFVVTPATTTTVTPALWQTFAERCSAALSTASIEFPPAVYDAQTALQLAQTKQSLRFRALAQHAVFAEAEDNFVLVDGTTAPLLQPRTVLMVPVASPANVHEYLAQHGIVLEAVSYNTQDAALLPYVAATGALRLTEHGQLQTPSQGAPHDGRSRIRDFFDLTTGPS